MNDVRESASTYTKGALVGGVILGAFALITRRRVFMWAAIGAIAGGFVAYKVSDSKKEVIKSQFKNYDSE